MPLIFYACFIYQNAAAKMTNQIAHASKKLEAYFVSRIIIFTLYLIGRHHLLLFHVSIARYSFARGLQ